MRQTFCGLSKTTPFISRVVQRLFIQYVHTNFIIVHEPGPEVLKRENILKLKIKKRNDWLLADTFPQAATH